VYDDTRAMFDYVFANFSKVMLRENETSTDIQSFVNGDAYIVLPNGVSFAEVEKEIEIVIGNQAIVTYTYAGQRVGVADVLVSRAYLESLGGGSGLDLNANDSNQGVVEPSELRSFTTGQMIMMVCAIVVFLIILLILIGQRKEHKRRERRRAQRRMMERRRQQEQRPGRHTAERRTMDRRSHDRRR